MEYVLAFLVLIGVLIWFHELGHFLMAKLFGVKVEIFSIGFGPVLISKKVGETEYRLSALPLGGFVKLYGEEEQIEDKRAFSSKPNWQKILIAFGGPLFNFILAILLFALIAMVGRQVPKYLYEEPLVGHVVEDSIAYKLGIKERDIILEINSKKVQNWKELENAIFENILAKEWSVKVLRNGEEVSLFLKDSVSKSAGFGAEPWLPAVLGRVVEDSPASQVGLQAGDKILKVNGKEINGWYELVKHVRESKDRPVLLTIQRGDSIEEKMVIPKVDPRTGMPILGIAPYVEKVETREPPLQAILEGFQRTYMLSILSLKALWSLITGGLSIKTLGGPIAIAQLAGESAQHGLIPFIGMMAFISVQLAIFNLIPLPILDGGLILLFLMESIRRKPFSPKFKEVWVKAGYAIIIVLAGFVILNDIMRILSGGRF
ncbi:RIP metalloprotease RseP [Hydrogenobacter sp. T-2]|uniref:RIP metalloprotease RseP n=1 Tax=Pampinifervens diazotrophicum TaxID=1632018 RepID=UPI002B25F864|nr:RIP metalloprotease RseP [Hydrogenobacter sp. T-2]WPM32438.1 RIP metalloprotease RseP [Hydrogenobacter sp. T-2]